MKILVIALSILGMSSYANAQNMVCNKAEALEAEIAVARLVDWNDIYKFYEKFKHCDDGAIAEGLSDSIVKMLARNWAQLSEFGKISASDMDFREFVMRHIDASADTSELKQIIIISDKYCAENALALCLQIEKKAREALSADTPRSNNITYSVRPEQGFVPDEKTALTIAETILVPIYGKENIESQKPFKIKLSGDVWTIEGTINENRAGGVFFIQISKQDARVIKVTHGK